MIQFKMPVFLSTIRIGRHEHSMHACIKNNRMGKFFSKEIFVGAHFRGF